MAFLRAARKDEIPAGTIREFQVDGKTLAISNMDGKLLRHQQHLPASRRAARRRAS